MTYAGLLQQKEALEAWHAAQPKRERRRFANAEEAWAAIPKSAAHTTPLTCPFCDGSTGLIYATHFRRPVNCEMCLKKSRPEAWAEMQAQRSRDDAAFALWAKEEIRKNAEHSDMRRGFCYWIPPKPMALAGGWRPEWMTQDQWYTYNLACRQKAKL